MPSKNYVNLCKNCGKLVKFAPSIYCSNQCQADYQYEAYIEQWKAGLKSGYKADGAVSDHVRRYLGEKYGERCTSCGWDKQHPITGRVPVEVHHISGDHQACSEVNLTLLCPNCHSLTPSYKALNKGNGRKHRLKTITPP